MKVGDKYGDGLVTEITASAVYVRYQFQRESTRLPIAVVRPVVGYVVKKNGRYVFSAVLENPQASAMHPTQRYAYRFKTEEGARAYAARMGGKVVRIVRG